MKRLALGTLVLLLGVTVAHSQELAASFQSLQDAQAKGDAQAVKKLALETSALARKTAAAPAPESEDEKDAWAKKVAYAKDIDSQVEYVLYAVAVKSPPATMVDLLATLETQNPKCKYLDDAYGSYLYALSQSGGSAKIPAVAAKGLENFPENTDLLQVMVNSEFAAQHNDRAQDYANRLIAAWGKKSRPENLSAEDFEKSKAAALGRGYWVSGIVSGQKNQYVAADKSLRVALPYIKGNNAMMAPALFYLGLANYNMGRMTNSKAKILEGAKFMDQCAALPGDYAHQAWKNSAVMKTEAGKMR